MLQHYQQVVSFTVRQLLDMVSPVNFIATNPEVLDATLREGGQNLLRGASHLLKDWERSVGSHAPMGADHFRPGHEVAVTPGKVVYRNHLIEPIEYAPQTRDVFVQPVLIVPTWIMRYNILDLSPHNLLVNYLVQRGHTRYMIL